MRSCVLESGSSTNALNSTTFAVVTLAINHGQPGLSHTPNSELTSHQLHRCHPQANAGLSGIPQADNWSAVNASIALRRSDGTSNHNALLEATSDAHTKANMSSALPRGATAAIPAVSGPIWITPTWPHCSESSSDVTGYESSLQWDHSNKLKAYHMWFTDKSDAIAPPVTSARAFRSIAQRGSTQSPNTAPHDHWLRLSPQQDQEGLLTLRHSAFKPCGQREEKRLLDSIARLRGEGKRAHQSVSADLLNATHNPPPPSKRHLQRDEEILFNSRARLTGEGEQREHQSTSLGLIKATDYLPYPSKRHPQRDEEIASIDGVRSGGVGKHREQHSTSVGLVSATDYLPQSSRRYTQRDEVRVPNGRVRSSGEAVKRAYQTVIVGPVKATDNLPCSPKSDSQLEEIAFVDRVRSGGAGKQREQHSTSVGLVSATDYLPQSSRRYTQRDEVGVPNDRVRWSGEAKKKAYPSVIVGPINATDILPRSSNRHSQLEEEVASNEAVGLGGIGEQRERQSTSVGSVKDTDYLPHSSKHYTQRDDEIGAHDRGRSSGEGQKRAYQSVIVGPVNATDILPCPSKRHSQLVEEVASNDTVRLGGIGEQRERQSTGFGPVNATDNLPSLLNKRRSEIESLRHLEDAIFGPTEVDTVAGIPSTGCWKEQLQEFRLKMTGFSFHSTLEDIPTLTLHGRTLSPERKFTELARFLIPEATIAKGARKQGRWLPQYYPNEVRQERSIKTAFIVALASIFHAGGKDCLKCCDEEVRCSYFRYLNFLGRENSYEVLEHKIWPRFKASCMPQLIKLSILYSVANAVPSLRSFMQAMVKVESKDLLEEIRNLQVSKPLAAELKKCRQITSIIINNPQVSEWTRDFLEPLLNASQNSMHPEAVPKKMS